MSYDLCLLPQAKKPYYIENIRMNIYSLEELCFYLYNNACLIDESLLNERDVYKRQGERSSLP